MDSNTRDKVRAALSVIDMIGVSYVLMVEDESGVPAFFCNNPINAYIVAPEKEI